MRGLHQGSVFKTRVDRHSIYEKFTVPPCDPRPVHLVFQTSHSVLAILSFHLDSLTVPIKHEPPPLEPAPKRRRRANAEKRSQKEREAEIEASLEACTEEFMLSLAGSFN